MKKTTPLLPLFKQLIKDSETGKRLKKNGERIKQQSIQNYYYVMQNLIQFSADTKFELRICDAGKLNKAELISEKKYWKKFYLSFTTYLYKKGCFDNYVGSNMKTIRVFFNYLKNEKDINVGNFHHMFYVRKEEVDIHVLSPDQLKFLINNKEFHESLTPSLQKIKDIFIFGCTTGLRFSDIYAITNKNFEQTGSDCYLKVKSVKTKTFTKIKLPEYAITIFNKYKTNNNKEAAFGKISLFNFNKSLKQIGEKAGFTAPVEISREIQGKTTKIASKTKAGQARFCDKMSSHMMRRTAITTLLILGMPEHLVRKISGHSAASSSFNRYVHYAQSYVDNEIDKVYNKLILNFK